MTEKEQPKTGETAKDSGREDEHRPLQIFINKKRFEESDGVKPIMTVDDLAALVRLTSETAVVRRLLSHDQLGEPLTGTVEIHINDQFVITRKRVEGGFDGLERVRVECDQLLEGGQAVQIFASPKPAVVFRALPVPNHPAIRSIDVLVQVPTGYPAAMIDWVALPADSALIGQVKGAPQGDLHCDGRVWKIISFHPHGNGGAGPWDPRVHGFHTYIQEILSWLGDRR